MAICISQYAYLGLLSSPVWISGLKLRGNDLCCISLVQGCWHKPCTVLLQNSFLVEHLTSHTYIFKITSFITMSRMLSSLCVENVTCWFSPRVKMVSLKISACWSWSSFMYTLKSPVNIMVEWFAILVEYSVNSSKNKFMFPSGGLYITCRCIIVPLTVSFQHLYSKFSSLILLYGIYSECFIV